MTDNFKKARKELEDLVNKLSDTAEPTKYVTIGAVLVPYTQKKENDNRVSGTFVVGEGSPAEVMFLLAKLIYNFSQEMKDTPGNILPMIAEAINFIAQKDGVDTGITIQPVTTNVPPQSIN